jgi:hypothetical protein
MFTQCQIETLIFQSDKVSFCKATSSPEDHLECNEESPAGVQETLRETKKPAGEAPAGRMF